MFVQTLEERDGHALMTVYDAPEDWRPPAEWAAVGSMVLPTSNDVADAALGLLESFGGVVEFGGEVYGSGELG